MGLFDFPAPIFSAIDSSLATAVPPVFRLVFWGFLCGWLTMMVYRFFSNQKKIGALKAEQKVQQKNIAEFDGEFAELMPMIGHTLALGFKQLGLALSPALIATVPVLFIVIWAAGEFGYENPIVGSAVFLTVEPEASDIHWSSITENKISDIQFSDEGWFVNWPLAGQELTMNEGNRPLLVLPLEHRIPIIHKKRWWNLLVANPLGYLPKDGKTDVINIQLPRAVMIGFGPEWMRGWMFTFFMTFLISSIIFKRLLRLD